MTLAPDASVVVAALADGGPAGTWAESVLLEKPLIAPHLMPIEVANILLRAADAGLLTADVSSLAHQQLEAMAVELFPYAAFSQRVWQLRRDLTCYDAWYVAVAEAFSAPLATLDLTLARSSGPVCAFLTPPAAQ